MRRGLNDKDAETGEVASRHARHASASARRAARNARQAAPGTGAACRAGHARMRLRKLELDLVPDAAVAGDAQLGAGDRGARASDRPSSSSGSPSFAVVVALIAVVVGLAVVVALVVAVVVALVTAAAAVAAVIVALDLARRHRRALDLGVAGDRAADARAVGQRYRQRACRRTRRSCRRTPRRHRAGESAGPLTRAEPLVVNAHVMAVMALVVMLSRHRAAGDEHQGGDAHQRAHQGPSHSYLLAAPEGESGVVRS